MGLRFAYFLQRGHGGLTLGSGGCRGSVVSRRLSVMPSEPESRSRVPLAMPPMPAGFAEAGLPVLQDLRGRRYRYLRLSVTDRCDFACVYCMPPSGEHDHAVRPELLSFEEAARLAAIFAASGVERVRFTGGEPLVRRDIVRLIDLVRSRTGLQELALTTNGSRLAELARPLQVAGLRGLNLSLDSLDPARFAALSRGGDLRRVLAGFHAALDAGLEVKLNTVVVGGQNDGEVERLVDFAFDHGVTVRFIELMPLGEAALLPPESFVPWRRIADRLAARLDPDPLPQHATRGPARYLPAKDGSGRSVGFITAVSEDFCGSCNRVRVTARGDVRACLASRTAVSLRDLLRAGANDGEIAWAIHVALGAKLPGHLFAAAGDVEHHHVGMSLIGG
jgi:cyclic pyranopterin phosphate synthase